MLRVSFLCGQRAIKDYDQKLRVVRDLTNQLSTGADKLLGSVEKMQEETKLMSRDLRLLRKEKLVSMAQSLENRFEKQGSIEVLMQLFATGESVDDLRTIATALCEAENRIVLLGTAGDTAMLLFRSSAGEDYHMGQLLRGVLEHIGSKSGGGRADQAQGGGGPASAADVLQALTAAKGNLAK